MGFWAKQSIHNSWWSSNSRALSRADQLGDDLWGRCLGLNSDSPTYVGNKPGKCLTSLCLSFLTCKMGINDWIVMRNPGIVISKQLKYCRSPVSSWKPLFQAPSSLPPHFSFLTQNKAVTQQFSLIELSWCFGVGQSILGKSAHRPSVTSWSLGTKCPWNTHSLWHSKNGVPEASLISSVVKESPAMQSHRVLSLIHRKIPQSN